MTEVALALAQMMLLVVVAPGLNGAIKTLKARLQGRTGPSPAQPYFELVKLLRKDEAVSEHASFVLRLAPAVCAAAYLFAAALVPVLWLPAPLAAWGDALLLVGLFALARFALALAGLDTGSAFAGMGSSREVAIAALTEPAVLLAIFAVAVAGGGTDLSALAAGLVARPDLALPPAQLLAGLALGIALVAETGRVPVDNPDTHLELTMVHEGMLIEYSGRSLGVVIWACLLKQVVLIALLVALFAPWGIATDAAGVPVALAAWVGKALAIGTALAVVESASAKLRILKVPELLGTASALAILALVARAVVP